MTNIIELRGIRRSYPAPGGETHVLRGIDIVVPQGSLVALSGPSGSGKTTLLNIAAGLDMPTAGEITIFDTPLTDSSPAQLAKLRTQIGLIFQSFALLATASAYENIEMSLRISGGVPRAQWHERIQRSLENLGLKSWAEHRPYELSGGQQQRVAIARALVGEPMLILADEPTGDLDSATSREVLGLFRRLANEKGMAILMVTHDPQAIEVSDLHYELVDGLLR